MRNCRKNKRHMWYALYEGKKPVYDENGDYTGEDTVGYSAPVEFEASLSSGSGTAQRAVFGTSVDFTRTISTTDKSLPIDENSLIWYETEPGRLSDGSADPDTADYEVSAPPADGQNVLVIALKNREKGYRGD